jgi:carbamate kinase
MTTLRMLQPPPDEHRLIVVALGGNALLRRGQPLEADVQRANVRAAASALAELARGSRLVIVHGNGPQIGLLALQSEAYAEVRPYPLDLLGAETEGMIGYMLQQELANVCAGRDVVAVLTQAVVDRGDAAFAAPSKPIGPVYGEAEARRLAAERGWTVAPDGPGWRRVVASPRPRAIVELRAIRMLVDAGVVVVAAGGGGIPVQVDPDGTRHGVEAVVDKDWAAAVLAESLGADTLVFLTDVAAVELEWRTARARPIRRSTPNGLAASRFEPGSMGPKVEAACWFVSETGRVSSIGAVRDAACVLRGEAGTRIEPDEPRRHGSAGRG